MNLHGRRESPMGILSLLPGDRLHCPRLNGALARHGVASPIGLKIKAHYFRMDGVWGSFCLQGQSACATATTTHIYYKIATVQFCNSYQGLQLRIQNPCHRMQCSCFFLVLVSYKLEKGLQTNKSSISSFKSILLTFYL